MGRIELTCAPILMARALLSGSRMKSPGFVLVVTLLVAPLACDATDTASTSTSDGGHEASSEAATHEAGSASLEAGDETDGASTSTSDGGHEASSESAAHEAGSTSLEAGDANDGARQSETGPACPNPVLHGDACSNEGAQMCGRLRSCNDVGTAETTFCTCRNGRYWCGDCPHCPVNLRNAGCGVGQVCDAVTLTTCGGETVSWSTCTCTDGAFWNCQGEDGGRQRYDFCSFDASAE